MTLGDGEGALSISPEDNLKILKLILKRHEDEAAARRAAGLAGAAVSKAGLQCAVAAAHATPIDSTERRRQRSLSVSTIADDGSLQSMTQASPPAEPRAAAAAAKGTAESRRRSSLAIATTHALRCVAPFRSPAYRDG